jgi:xanthine/CO dehydrogenase XdhC/CoxF family maturation factor
MNFSLLDKIDAIRGGILTTILRTEGHTYKKQGARALFAPGAPRGHAPVWGNLGSVCVDQELVRQGGEATADGKPRTVRIDTSEVEDADFGYGTFCGGVMEVLIEPITDAHKTVYQELRRRLESGLHSWLVHDLDTGELSVEDSEPTTDDRTFAEEIPPLVPLCMFGATPLAHRLVELLDDMDYRLRVIDWRQDYLDGFAGIDGVTSHLDEMTFEKDTIVLIMSHHYHRDKAVLEEALSRHCAFVGMLSSKTRRDQMYEDLRQDGVAAADLKRVCSPVGLDIGGRSDAEIAVAIAAQLVRWRNR